MFFEGGTDLYRTGQDPSVESNSEIPLALRCSLVVEIICYLLFRIFFTCSMVSDII